MKRNRKRICKKRLIKRMHGKRKGGHVIVNDRGKRTAYLLSVPICGALLVWAFLSAWNYAFRLTFSPYPVLGHTLLLIQLIAIAGLAHALFRYGGNLMRRILPNSLRAGLAGLFMLLCLVVSVLLRVWIVQNAADASSAGAPEYQLALLMRNPTQDTQGNYYLNYLAQHPYQYYYASVLSKYFILFAQTLTSALAFQTVLSLANVVLAALLAFRLGGMKSMLLTFFLMCFWPSQLLMSASLSSVPMLTGLFLLTAAVTLHILRQLRRRETLRRPLLLVLELVGLSVLLAWCTYTELPGFLAFFSVLAVLAQAPSKHFQKEENAIQRFLSYRSLCIVLVSIGYFFSLFVTHETIRSFTRQDTPRLSPSMGYSLMIGSNPDSLGLWNQTDVDRFYQVMEETGSAVTAQADAAAVFRARMGGDFSGTLRMFANEKFPYLWRQDLFSMQSLEAQWAQTEQDTAGRQQLSAALNALTGVWQRAYLALLFIAVLSMVRLLRREQRRALPLLYTQALLMLFCMVFEPLSAYHDTGIPMLITLASFFVGSWPIQNSFETDREISLSEEEANEQAFEKHYEIDFVKLLDEQHIRLSVTEKVSDSSDEENTRRIDMKEVLQAGLAHVVPEDKPMNIPKDPEKSKKREEDEKAEENKKSETDSSRS